jgi:predicted alpha/beta-fold hydrolase
MPLIAKSEYVSPAYLPNGHLQTIIPSLLRKVKGVTYTRERLDTPDGDFLDLDWSRTNNSKHLGIICHGLEGDSNRPYILGMAKALNNQRIDALAWNYRGCSGESNSRLRFYHSGATEDLRHLIETIIASGHYSTISLFGFSLGGNLVLKYLGEEGTAIPVNIYKAVVFSVPCDLAGSSKNLCSLENQIYNRRFLKSLKIKIKTKARQLPGKINIGHLKEIKTLKEFDEKYTAPLHGFKDADEYYEKCSSRSFIDKIKVPTLIVNAKNDPFLSLGCYPTEEVKNNAMVFLEIPAQGGHCGFYLPGASGEFWSEKRALEFLNDNHHHLIEERILSTAS